MQRGVIDTWNSLTDSEKLLIIRYPFAAFKVNSAKTFALEKTGDKFGYNGLGGRSDTFRHSIWNAKTAIDIGEEFAEQFAAAHEDVDTSGYESDGFLKKMLVYLDKIVFTDKELQQIKEYTINETASEKENIYGDSKTINYVLGTKTKAEKINTIQKARVDSCLKLVDKIGTLVQKGKYCVIGNYDDILKNHAYVDGICYL